MLLNRENLIVPMVSGVCIALALAGVAVRADDAATVRSQAVVNLTFDEASGDALDSAAAGAAKDNGTLQNGAVRFKSPFWGQSGKQALVLDAATRQLVQVADSPDLDRADAVSFSMFFVNLHPATDAAFHGLIAKRDDAKQTTNYGINYAANIDTLQIYVNDGTGFKTATYSLNASVGYRRPVFITAALQVGDAPAPDADEDKDDVLIRFFINGQPVKPKGSVGGMVAGTEAWLTDVKVGNLLNDVPLTLGASSPASEFTSCVIDEFSLFAKALSPDEAVKLFVEVAGPGAAAQIVEDAKPVPAGPEISRLSLNGLTRGQTTVLAISGSNLLPDPVIVSSAPIEKQAVRPGSTPERIEVELTIAPSAPAGHFPIRVQTLRGISGTLSIAIDSLPQVPFSESSPEKPVTLPIAISGTLTGQQQVKVYFAGKSGQRVVVDLECKRLGSAMEPVLELRNPRGAPLSIAWGRPQYGGDTRIEANLFADGVYSVELHDLAYKAPGENTFRLKIGDLKLIDTTFPPAVAAGSQRSVAVIGPGMDPAATLNVDVQHQLAGLGQNVVLPPETGAVGPAPNVVSSGAVELMEEPQSEGKLQTIDAQFAARPHVPLVVNGRISRHGETDKYVLQVQPGMTLNLSVESYGIHSPLDPQLVILSSPDGSLQAVSEERPQLNFAVPAGTSAIQVGIRDLNHRGGPEYIYRLRIIPAGQPDFSLAVSSDRLSLARDGGAVLRLDVTRTAYDGPIALSLAGAPELALSPAEVPAGVAKAFVVVSSKNPDATAGLQLRHLNLVGTSVGLDPPLRHVALAPPESRLALVPGARADLTAALTAPKAVALEIGTLPPAWFRGMTIELPLSLKIQNAELAKHAVRLTLVTTEAPRTDVDPTDPARQRRITLPMLHSLPEQTWSAGETSGTLRIAVPLDVAEPQIDCIVRADFVPHAFSDKVLASVTSSPFRLPIQNALAVQLAVNALNLTSNAQTKFTGTIKRTAGFTLPVEVALINLPAGYTAPKATVPAEQEQFEIVVTAPAVTAAADLPNIQFRVTIPTGGQLQKDVPIATKVAPQ